MKELRRLLKELEEIKQFCFKHKEKEFGKSISQGIKILKKLDAGIK